MKTRKKYVDILYIHLFFFCVCVFIIMHVSEKNHLLDIYAIFSFSVTIMINGACTLQ